MHFRMILPFLALASAAPLLVERDLFMFTETDWVIETITQYTTIYPAGDVAPATSIASNPVNTIGVSSALPSPAPVTALAQSPKPSPPVFISTTEQAPASIPSTTSSTIVAPTTPVTVQQQTSAAPVVPVASSSSVAAQPTTPAAAGGGVTYLVSTLTGASAPDGPCTPSQPCSGDITHYNPSAGLGACGYKDWTTQSIYEDTDMVVAIPSQMFGSVTNGGVAGDTGLNELCKRSVHIKAQSGGPDVIAKVVDKCAGCALATSLDLSPAVFDAVAPNGDGRVHDVEWYWV